MFTVALAFDRSPFDLDAIRAQLPGLNVESWADWRDWDEATLAERCRAVDVMVTSRSSPRVPDALIDDRGRLQLVAHCHGHVKQLVSEAHLRAGLRISNWGDNVFGVAEAALMLMLACVKQLPSLAAFIASDWRDDRRVFQDHPASLATMTVGIYGFGPIGRHFARLLAAFGCTTLVYDPYATALPPNVEAVESLAELFDRSDAISIHCGLNDATRGSVNGDLLDRLPQGGVVVNTARGPIINEDDLISRVQAGRLVVALDVIENERQWAQSPMMGLPNALLTGHKASSGKGPDPEWPQPPKGLPEFVVTNILALANDRPDAICNEIPVQQFAIKT